MSKMITELRNMNFQQVAVRASDVLPPWLALLLVLALAWQLGQLTWMLIPRSEAVIIQGPVADSRSSAPATRPTFDTSSIIRARLFGEQAATPVVPTQEFTDIDDTDLRLTLRGTIAANEESMAMAIISDDRGNEKVYSVGDTVNAGRKLHSVLPDRAILNNNGKLEALRLPRESGETAATSNSSNSRARSAARSPAGNRLQQSLAENPARLTDLIRPQPVFSNGKQIGYRVYPGRRRQQFLTLGLKPGDLVTQINGTPLNDPARGAEIFKSLADASQVTVTVERNGTPQVLVLDPENISTDGKPAQ